MSWRSNIRDEIRSMAPAQPRAAGAVWLDANESPFGLSPEDSAALAQHLAGVNLNRYPESSAEPLRKLLAGRLGVDAEAILVGGGTQDLVRLLCSTFSKLKQRESRPRVGYPLPSPSHYKLAVISQGARPLEMPLREDFGLDLVAMERQITGGHPNLLLFCRPNDPTGNVWSREEMVKVIEEHPEIVVAVDETYFDFCQETLLDLVGRYPHVVILRSLSKVGLAGLRVGYLVGHPELVQEVHKVRPAHSISTLTLEATLWLLEHYQAKLEEHARQTLAERDRLATALQGIEGVRVSPSLGNFLLLQVADAAGVARALLRRGVSVVEVGEGLPNGLRVSIGAVADNARLVQMLPEAVASPEPAPPASRHKQAEVVADEEASRQPASGLPKFL